ncbi:MAG: glutamate--tRNA ligase family protein, partial [Thermoplasmata archaeon]|nr:glutamate--tRNA ligase family protein [Thermoplasmata archaeon]
MTLPPETDVRLRRLLLENAVEHDGQARAGPIVSRLLADVPQLRAQSSELRERADMILLELSGLPAESQRAELARLGGPERARVRAPKGPVEGVFPDLPGAEVGHVVLRMAPFPSGALHIGNARMLYVNEHYRQRYGGRLLLVFDDTVGSEEKRIAGEVFDVILHDLELADVRPDEVHYKSDRLPIAYSWALRVIERDGAYVCTCSAEILRDRRAHGEACPERSQTR